MKDLCGSHNDDLYCDKNKPNCTVGGKCTNKILESNDRNSQEYMYSYSRIPTNCISKIEIVVLLKKPLFKTNIEDI